MNKDKIEAFISSVIDDVDWRKWPTRVVILGLAFKSGTNDTRGSVAIPLMKALHKKHALVGLHDPLMTREEADSALSNASVPYTYFNDPYNACRGANAVVLLTDCRLTPPAIGSGALSQQRLAKSLTPGTFLFDPRHLLDRTIFESRRIRIRAFGRGSVF